MSTQNVFERILDGEIPCDTVFENDDILAFRDIAPQAPVHIVIIPKKKGIVSIQEVASDDEMAIVVKIIAVAQQLARDFRIDKTGYRLLTNAGLNSGQEVLHLHFHLIGGAPLGPLA